MKLWTSVTNVPDDENHYVVVGIEEEYIADMLRLAAVPLPDLIEHTLYSVPADRVDARVYARSVATDAVLGARFMNEGEDEDLEDVLDVASYDSGAEPVGYDSFESLHNALTLAGSKDNPDWCYETYVKRIELATDGVIEVPVGIQVSEDTGAERVHYIVININPEP
jgi:hypothetical protein